MDDEKDWTLTFTGPVGRTSLYELRPDALGIYFASLPAKTPKPYSNYVLQDDSPKPLKLLLPRSQMHPQISTLSAKLRVTVTTEQDGTQALFTLYTPWNHHGSGRHYLFGVRGACHPVP